MTKEEWDYMFKPTLIGIIGSVICAPLIALFFSYTEGADWLLLTGILMFSGIMLSIVIGMGAGGLEMNQREDDEP